MQNSTDSILVLASGNRGKLEELSALLDGSGLRVASQARFRVEEAEETGLSFVENAILKARNAARQSGHPALADDSGLCVDVLRGAPGIYSARYAGSGASDRDNIEKLLVALANYPQRRAHFHCALCFVRHAQDPAPIICEGRWQGEILRAPLGEGGFGYDPVFFDPELKRSAAELAPAEKARRSHRGLALAALLPRLQAEYLSQE